MGRPARSDHQRADPAGRHAGVEPLRADWLSPHRRQSASGWTETGALHRHHWGRRPGRPESAPDICPRAAGQNQHDCSYDQGGALWRAGVLRDLGGEEDPMAIVPVSSTSGGGGELRPTRADGWVRDASSSLERLAPLIHELIAWDLIYRGETGAFQLREDVQQLLETRLAGSPPGPAQVFVGRKCERCGTVTVTRLIDGTRLCGRCTDAGGAAPPVEPLTGSDPRTGRRHPDERSHWLRKANRKAS
jgi:hypothetical protein